MKTLIAYTGNASFASRQAAFQAEDGQRFFVRPDGWADIRVASLAGLQKLLPDGEYRPGGTASSKLQVRHASGKRGARTSRVRTRRAMRSPGSRSRRACVRAMSTRS